MGVINPQQNAVIIVDYVLFPDGTSWGPNSLGQASALKGMQQGWRLAVSTLKRMLNEQGPTAVASYLKPHRVMPRRRGSLSLTYLLSIDESAAPGVT
jgi:hypothetical protein